jgi:hypothetical protein
MAAAVFVAQNFFHGVNSPKYFDPHYMTGGLAKVY